jgi:Ca2+-binding EF-hand superfamily protein
MIMKTQLSTAVILALSCNFVGAAPNFPPMGAGMMPSLPRHAPPFERLLDRFDVNQDGAVSQDEVQAVHQAVFTTADVNADGFLTIDELETAHLQQREEHLADRFAELDQNGDGSISADEFATNGRNPQCQPAGHFTEMDSNGDSLVTLEEMRAGMQARDAAMADRHQQMQQQKFARLDNDGDGLVSLVEFSTNLPMFDHLDTNEDGIITAEEAAAAQPLRGQSPQGKKGFKRGNAQ